MTQHVEYYVEKGSDMIAAAATFAEEEASFLHEELEEMFFRLVEIKGILVAERVHDGKLERTGRI